MKTITLPAALLCAGLAAGCGSSPKEIHYYQLAMPEEGAGAKGQGVLAVEQIVADSAFDDQRIVYRKSAYRLNYYHYHRWSAPPGMMVSDYLRMAYRQSGRFDDVVSGFTPDATTVLSGRVMALEEVDVSKEEWKARVRIQLHLRDARTGKLLWSGTVSKEEPVKERNPEGLAAALSAAMADVVAETTPEIARHTSAQAKLAE